MTEYNTREQVCRKRRGKPLPWKLGKPCPVLVDLFESQKVIPKGMALDVCCGLGTNTIYLAQAGFQTTAIDISKSAVAQAQRNVQKAGVAIRLCVSTVLDLPFENHEFDFVFGMGCAITPRPRTGRASSAAS
jgi:2-polyprenyl-3-methyl-5-hydroxy-6-metoxy-1,4-benzoquinol methylase